MHKESQKQSIPPFSPEEKRNDFFQTISEKSSLLLYRFTTPTLLVIFTLGLIGIFSFINHEQDQLLKSFSAQEETLYQFIDKNSPGEQHPKLLTKSIFNQTQEDLHDTFLILAGSLTCYLLVIIFVIRKLKINAQQLQSLIKQLQGMNGELQNEIVRRDEMSHKLESLNGELKYQSLHDALTKLPNRRLFEDRLDLAIQASKRNKLIFAVVFLDLDGFKLINDTLGHDIGDKLLIEVSTRFLASIRSMDTVARFGGDEFAFVLTELDKPESAAVVAERILKILEGVFLINGQHLNINASIGITTYPYDSDSAQILLKNADIAMYQAKNKGRGNFQFYREDMNVASKRELLLRNAFSSSLQNAELSLHYQPIVDTTKNAIIAFEALLRWQHPQLGNISPQEMLKLADHLGLHLQLGEWVLQEACQQIKRWEEIGFAVPQIAINITSLELESRNFVAKFKQVLQTFQVPAEKIILEATEAILVSNTSYISETLKELNQYGVKVAIDDFGIGYSSLNHLRRFPLQILKINPSFVQELSEENESTTIVKAVIALAQALHLQVVAEGVETQEQMHILMKLGCQQMQGYLFSRPLPPDQCVNLIIPNKD